MPSKSKKSRRPQTRATVAPVGGSDTSGTNSTLNTQSAAAENQAGKISTVGRVSKSAVVEPPVGTYFLSELKWIALVTVIITILLIASYYIFR
jgi:hypothetical protein